MKNMDWKSKTTLISKSYTCGHCGNPIASNEGYIGDLTHGTKIYEYIYICHFCGSPTYFDVANHQIPNSPYGKSVDKINDENVKNLYKETRGCISCNAYTASVLCSRKLLMNIAVSKGAKEGLHFIQYVEYLSDKNYIPPNGKDWVDHIRKKGNEATHEISIKTEEEAKELIDFLEMLLKFIYEFPARIKSKKLQPTA